MRPDISIGWIQDSILGDHESSIYTVSMTLSRQMQSRHEAGKHQDSACPVPDVLSIGYSRETVHPLGLILAFTARIYNREKRRHGSYIRVSAHLRTIDRLLEMCQECDRDDAGEEVDCPSAVGRCE